MAMEINDALSVPAGTKAEVIPSCQARKQQQPRAYKFTY